MARSPITWVAGPLETAGASHKETGGIVTLPWTVQVDVPRRGALCGRGAARVILQ